MSLRADGVYRCDRCGSALPNSGVLECATVSTLAYDEDGSPEVRGYHFCREPNEGAPDGCAEHLLTPSVLADYLAERQTP